MTWTSVPAEALLHEGLWSTPDDRVDFCPSGCVTSNAPKPSGGDQNDPGTPKILLGSTAIFDVPMLKA
jgi:hypothetical protein